jgi:hypothetical protein
MISVRFVAADKKLTQSETKEFQRQLMWMQFYLAIAQIVSEDLPQTAINMVVADEIGDYTFTAGLSIAASVFAAGALLLEIGRRVYVAVKEGAVVARERRVSEFVASGVHMEEDGRTKTLVKGLLTWRSLESYTRCYRGAWRAVHAGGSNGSGQKSREEKSKLEEDIGKTLLQEKRVVV